MDSMRPSERKYPDKVPLQSISVDVVIQEFIADVVSELRYKNKDTVPLEVVVDIRLDKDVAVYAFEGLVDGTRVEAQIMEKAQARQKVKEIWGKDAALFERDPKKRDVFGCRLGSLPPGGEATLKLRYVQALAPALGGRSICFILPVVPNPRCIPQGLQEKSPMNCTPQLSEEQLPYSLCLSATLGSHYGISHVESNYTLTGVQYRTEDHTTAQVSLEEGHHFEQDVELLIYYGAEFHKPVALVELGKPGAVPGSVMGDPVLLLSLHPKVSAPKPSLNATGEFFFLVDCSSNMTYSTEKNLNSRSRIQSAKEMLIFLLKSLPLGSYFNIYAFGCSYFSFYLKSVKYTQWTMLDSLRRVMELKANLGDAEILQPLKEIYSQPCMEGYARQLFVFMHTETSDKDEVIAEVETHNCSHRCFTFGIGECPATETLEGMAKAGHGCAEFIRDTEKMQVRALQSMKKAMDPVMMDISLHWDLPSGLEARLVQPIPQIIYTGEYSLICAQISGQQQDVSLSEGSVVVQYSIQGWTFTEKINFSLQGQENERFPLHRLTAQALLQELKGTSSMEERQLALETSLSSGVLSAQTAYIVLNTESGRLFKIPIYFQNLFGFSRCGSSFIYDDLIDIIETMETNVDKIIVRRGCTFCPSCTSRFSNISIFKKIQRTAEFLRKIYYSAAAVLASNDISWKSYSTPRDFLQGHSVIFDQPGLPTKKSLVLKLICLQNADGSWSLDTFLLNILGLHEVNTCRKMPTQVVPTAWATVLAILWLHVHAAEESDTWQLLEAKALGWLHENTGPQLAECVQAGNIFLMCDISLEVFGL